MSHEEPAQSEEASSRGILDDEIAPDAAGALHHHRATILRALDSGGTTVGGTVEVLPPADPASA